MITKSIAILAASFVITVFPLKTLDEDKSTVSYNTDHGIAGIEIIGDITPHTADVVREAFQVFEKGHYSKVVIHLNSDGGDVPAGADIIQEMLTAEDKYGMTVSTYVDHREVCASMCTAIYATGNFRVAAWDSRWVFHSPFLVFKNEKEENSPKTAQEQKELDEEVDSCRRLLMAAYERVDPKWADEVLKPYIYSKDKALRLTGAQIVDNGSPWWIDYVLEEDLTGK